MNSKSCCTIFFTRKMPNSVSFLVVCAQCIGCLTVYLCQKHKTPYKVSAPATNTQKNYHLPLCRNSSGPNTQRPMKCTGNLATKLGDVCFHIMQNIDRVCNWFFNQLGMVGCDNKSSPWWQYCTIRSVRLIAHRIGTQLSVPSIHHRWCRKPCIH
jgi:hypothetical protein